MMRRTKRTRPRSHWRAGELLREEKTNHDTDERAHNPQGGAHPVCQAGGALREVHPDALLAQTPDGLLERAGLDAENRGLGSLYNVRWDSLVPTSL